MTWDQIQQLLRIVLYSLGAYLLGDATASGEAFQGLIGGVINVGAFVWWWYWQRGQAASTDTLKL